MKVLAVGDVHGDTSSVCNVAIPKARKEGCKLIIQVGDFGYFEHYDTGKRFLNKVSKCLVREKMTMFWIDGNHENHPLLWETYPAIHGGMYGYPRKLDGLSEIRPNLFYVPRGHIMKIGPANCLFVGGAYSIDKHGRIQDELALNEPATRWWATEEITDSDVERSIRHVEASEPIDLMFTHDVPTGLNVPGVHSGGNEFFPEAERNRVKLRQIYDAAQPRMLVHGHYHMRYTDKLPLRPTVGSAYFQDVNRDGPFLDWDYCRVDGLACNGMWGFCVVLDLDSLFISE